MRYWILAAAAMLSAPASAKVVHQTDSSFTVEHQMTVAADAATIWRLMGQPAKWWSGDHSYSGDAANFSMSLQPGGCFCEALPGGGGVEHARVVYVAPDKVLRLRGALGPLQAQAVTGALTFTLTPAEGGGTMLSVRYAVSGDASMAMAKIAPAVDGVIGEQATRLKAAAEAAAK